MAQGPLALDVLVEPAAQPRPRLDEGLVGQLNPLPSAVTSRAATSDITCPTVIIHGTADWDVVPEHAERAHARIDGSRLIWVTDGSHLGFFLSRATQTEALDWLASTRT